MAAEADPGYRFAHLGYIFGTGTDRQNTLLLAFTAAAST